MDVNEAKSKFKTAQKAVLDCQSNSQTLQAKADQLQDSLPNLSRAVEAAEKEKQVALDNFAMTSNKQTESFLRIARTACEQAARQRIETNELIEATDRSLKKMESEVVRLNNASEMAKRQVWEAISESYESKIKDEVKGYVSIITIIGSQIGRPRQYVLDCLFKNPTHDDVQEIQRNLREEYNID